MDDKIIKQAYGVLPPNVMSINEMLYEFASYIKANATKGDQGYSITDVNLSLKTDINGVKTYELTVKTDKPETIVAGDIVVQRGEKGEQGVGITAVSLVEVVNG